VPLTCGYQPHEVQQLNASIIGTYDSSVFPTLTSVERRVRGGVVSMSGACNETFQKGGPGAPL